MIKLISPTTQDQIILLGDIFDRGGAEPDPVGVYFRICGLNTNVKWIRGNHDHLWQNISIVITELSQRSEAACNHTGIIHSI